MNDLVCPTCGFTAHGRTPALLEASFKFHRCERHLALAERAKRVAARRERTPVPCTHGGRHRCGRVVKYRTDGCRCPACVEAVRRYDVELRRRQEQVGGSTFVDAGPVRAHLRMLIDRHGMTTGDIARQSGYRIETIARILRASVIRDGERVPVRRVHVDTADVLLQVKPATPHRRGDTIPSLGARRRLQALMIRGWTLPRLAEQTDRITLAQLRNVEVRQAYITPRTHAAIVDLYDRLWDVVPEPRNAKEAGAMRKIINHANRAHWAPPLAWDDIDDPKARPSGVKWNVPPPRERPDPRDPLMIERACQGQHVPLTRAQRREAVRRLHGFGLLDPQIAERLHTSDRTVLRIRNALGLASNYGRVGQRPETKGSAA